MTTTGANFNTTPANNIVFFGATMATVSAAASTQLIVTVSVGATYQYISATGLSTGLTTYSSQPFITTFNACVPVINTSSFSTKVDFTTEIRPISFAIGDLDGDGKKDIVVLDNPACK